MKLLRLMALVAFLPFAALAGSPMSTVQPVDGSGVPLGTPSNPLYISGGGGGGGGGATGSVTSAGTNGAAAQAVQGINGGVPMNGFVGQYNSTLPTFTSAQVGYVALDSNGRLILSPGGFISVANFPTTQAVSGTVTANLGTLNGAALDSSVQAVKTALGSPFQAGGSIGNTAFGISGQLPAFAATPTFNLGSLNGAATAAGQAAQQGSVAPGTAAGFSVLAGQIYNSTAPAPTNGQQLALQADAAGNLKVNNATLPPGAATASNQASEIAALGTTGDTAYAGSGTASIIAALKGVYTATLAPLAAGTNTVGSIANITGTVSLPTGAASAANQNTEIAALQAIQQRAAVFVEQAGASVAASGTTIGTSRDAGGTPLYTKFNAVVSSNQNGTLFLQGSNDNFTSLVALGSVAVTAGVPSYITAPLIFRYNREVFANGNTTNAATVSINSSYTAN